MLYDRAHKIGFNGLGALSIGGVVGAWCGIVPGSFLRCPGSSKLPPGEGEEAPTIPKPPNWYGA